ncbi:MAG TPA: gamma-glutamylcyclotransferase family protein [Conexibacter sp.]|nr:gamma-glutamylcyclotransferase family protein [Conexibacter sp.]
MELVFGYGSLAAVAIPGERVFSLHGHRRRWGVAMDNREAIPGYKRYVDTDGSHPAVHVAFLDLLASPDDDAVNGVCRPVTAAQLAALDARERNYDRRDVTAHVADPPGRVWAYVGSAAGRARLAAGTAAGCAVVSREYLDLVLRGFARLGVRELARFHACSDLDGLPVRDLRRVDLSD